MHIGSWVDIPDLPDFSGSNPFLLVNQKYI